MKTYQFPPPEWFESGTVSHLVLAIVFWLVVIGLPVSVLGCWFLKPRSRPIWIIAELFWVLISIFSLPQFSLPLWSGPPAGILNGVPEFLTAYIFAMLVILPFPAAVAGLMELTKHSDRLQRGFYSMPVWVCSVILVVVMFGFGLWMPGGHGHSREPSRRSECKHNLKQIGLAMHNYHDESDGFPDLQFRDDDSPPRSWRVELLPFVDHQANYNSYDRQAAWDSTSNLPLAQKNLRVYVCPSVPKNVSQDASGRWYSAYATLIGPQTAFPNGKGLSMKSFTDGSSNTVLVVEACGQQIVWTEPKDIEDSDQNLGINLPGTKPNQSPASWSSYHHGGAHTLLADGAARFVSKDIDPRVLRALTTVDGGDTVPDNW